jgi:hypothetical protein
VKAFALLGALALLGCSASSTNARAPDAPPARFGKVASPPAVTSWMKLPKEGDAEVLAVEAGVAGDRVAALLEVPEAECVILIARGTRSVDDVDLFAYGEDGAVLGSDEASDKAPALLVCPPHPRRIYVSARIAAGHGMVAIGAQRVAVKDAERAASLYGVRHRPGEIARRLSVWPGLDEQVEQHRRALGGSWVDVRRVAVPLDSRLATRLSAGVERERCLDVFVLPSDDVAYLDVQVLDERGGIVGRAPTVGRSRSLVVCSPTESAITIEIRPHAGIGLAVVMLSRSTEGTERDIDARAARFDLYPMGSLDETRLRSSGERRARRVATGTLEMGRRNGVELDLPRGCARVEVTAGAPLRGVEAWLWAPDGALLANSRGGAGVTLHACTSGGKARLDVEPIARGGPYAVELLQETEGPATLLTEPLAAGRLLERMLARGVITSATQVTAVEELSLEPTRLSTLDIKVPVARCVDLTAAMGPGGSGVELRFVNGENGEELGLFRGSDSVSGRVCALRSGKTLAARAELRALAGKARALVATRLIDPRE